LLIVYLGYEPKPFTAISMRFPEAIGPVEYQTLDRSCYIFVIRFKHFTVFAMTSETGVVIVMNLHRPISAIRASHLIAGGSFYLGLSRQIERLSE